MKNDLPEAVATTAASGAQALALRVRQVRLEGVGIHSYELVDADEADLPAFDAGSHIDVHLPDGVVRQYSLSNDPAERHRYVIAVLRDEHGRGGSKAAHATLHVGDVVRTSVPRNHFHLAPDARKVVLIAGGIGVTPLKAMAHQLERDGVDFEMHYCAKAREFVAFSQELRALQAAGKLRFHFDGGDPAKGLDLGALLRDPLAGTHVYYCGPSGFMKACAAAASSWPAGSVHCEHFKAPEPEVSARTAADKPDDGRFTIRIHSTGALVDVGPDESIVDALGGAGVHIETSCTSGLCGTCKVRYLAGSVDHKDYILSDDEHAEFLTCCVSRSKEPVLELDL